MTEYFCRSCSTCFGSESDALIHVGNNHVDPTTLTVREAREIFLSVV